MKKSLIASICCWLVLSFCIGAGSAVAEDGPGELIVPVPVQPSKAAAKALDALLYDYQIFEMPLVEIDDKIRNANKLAMHLGNRTMVLDLELNNLYAPDYRLVLMREDGPVELEPPPVDTYRGSIKGEAGSIVRLTVRPDRFEGYARTENLWLFFEPVSEYSKQAAPNHIVVYRDLDVRPIAGEMLGMIGLQSRVDHFLADPSKRPASSGTVQLATDGDGGFVQDHGTSGAQSRINSTINSVDGIYEAELNLSVTIVFSLLWSNPATDPYEETQYDLRLFEFQDYWNSVFSWVSRDATQQFTDNLTGAAGVAFVGVMCRFPTSSYGVTEDRSSLNQVLKITAHEIGHMLNANHDNQAPVCPGVNCNGSGPLMCSSIQSSGPLEFSDCSQDDVADYVAANGSCL